MKFVLITAAVTQVNCDVQKNCNNCNGHEFPYQVMRDGSYHESIIFERLSTLQDRNVLRNDELLYCFIANSTIEGKPGEIGIYTVPRDKDIKFYCDPRNGDFSGIEEEQDEFINKVFEKLRNKGFGSSETVVMMLGISNSKIVRYGFKKLQSKLIKEGYLCFASYLNEPRRERWNEWLNFCSSFGDLLVNFIQDPSADHSYDGLIKYLSDEQLTQNLPEYIIIDENFLQSDARGLVAFFILLKKLAREARINQETVDVLKAWSVALEIRQSEIEFKKFLDKLLGSTYNDTIERIFEKIATHPQNASILWDLWCSLNVDVRKDIIELVKYNFPYSCLYVLKEKYRNRYIDTKRKNLWSRCLSCDENNTFSTAKLFDWEDPFRNLELWGQWGNANNLSQDDVSMLTKQISIWTNIDDKGDSSTEISEINDVEGTDKCNKCGKFTIKELSKAHDDITKVISNFVKSSIPVSVSNEALSDIRDEDQINAIKKILEETNLLLLTGGAGTGKTYTIGKICQILKSKGWSFECATLTGRAASRLTLNLKKHGVNTRGKTFHQLLKITPPQGISGYYDNWCPQRAQEENITTKALIIDESSMVDEAFLCEVLKRVNFEKLILAGDPNQLPPVQGAGEPFRHLCEILDKNKVTLKKCHRAQGKKIPEQAENILNGIAPQSDNNEVIIEDVNEERVVDRVKKWYEECRENGETDIDTILLFRICQAIVPTHKLRRKVNHIMQEYTKSQCFLNNEWKNRVTNWFTKKIEIRNLELEAKDFFFPGDKILCIKNFGNEEGRENNVIAVFEYDEDSKTWKKVDRPDVDIRIYNGEVGWYIGWYDNRIIVAIDREIEIVFYSINISNLTPNFWHGYGITIHKAQGSEWDYVALVCRGKANKDFYNRRLLYTGFTRAKKQITVFNINNALVSWTNQEARERQSCLKCKFLLMEMGNYVRRT